VRWALPVVGIGLLALILAVIFAWQKSPIERGWDPDRLVVDTARVHTPDEENLSGELVAPYWMDQLKKSRNQPVLPADEMFINWDLVTPEFRQSVVITLVFEGLNRFDKRCLKHFLQEEAVSHTWVESEPLVLRLEQKKPDYAYALLDQLATFDLNGHLQVLQETKPY
jgi:hypothetical protein